MKGTDDVLQHHPVHGNVHEVNATTGEPRCGNPLGEIDYTETSRSAALAKPRSRYCLGLGCVYARRTS